MNKLKNINWNHIYYFYETAKFRSIKDSAKQIGIAPSTLSEQIKKLEKTLGKRLFARIQQGLVLTESGEILFSHARKIFDEGIKVLDKFSLDEVAGYTVNVGIEETIFGDIATEFVSQYWDLYTSYGIVNTLRQVDNKVLVENLIQDVVDWGITLRTPKRKELVYDKIGAFKVLFCCSDELFDRFKDPEDILRNIPIAESYSDKVLNSKISNYLQLFKIMPKEKILSDHSDFIKKLCLRGRCVMVVPENPLEDYNGLRTFQLDTPLSLEIYAVWKKSNENLVLIRKLKELISTKIIQVPERYEDVDLQIEVSDIPDEILK